jgi:hypothetical protein
VGASKVGIDLTALRALFLIKRLNLCDFSKTVTLGRHEIFFSKEEFQYVKNRSGVKIRYDCEFSPFSFQEKLLRVFGSAELVSIDASDYEKANIIHNFNTQIPVNLYRKFSLFLDFGSMEHIFNVKQVLGNIGLLLEIGGHALILTDANGNAGHGLYQFSPEFFYSAFSEENGFSDTVVCLIDKKNSRNWLAIKPPKWVRGRVNIPPGNQYYVLCLTRKVANVEKFVVEQSDYVDAAWHLQNHQHAKKSKLPAAPLALLRRGNIFTYIWVRSLYYEFRVRAAFKAHRFPFVPESALKAPHELLTEMWR